MATAKEDAYAIYEMFDEDFMKIMKAIHDQDKKEVSLLVTEIYKKYFVTEALATSFLTWLFAQTAVNLFELLATHNMTIDDELKVHSNVVGAIESVGG